MKGHKNNNNNFIVVNSPAPLSLINEFNKISHIGNLDGKITNHFGQLYETSNRYELAQNDDLFNCMRYFLIFGRCIGVVPISGVFGEELHELQFRTVSLAGLLSLVIILILSCNTGLAWAGFVKNGGNDAFRLAKGASAAVCYSMGLFVFVFIFRNSQNIINLFHKWRCIQSMGYNYVDTSLAITINIIAGLILASGISENAVSHLHAFLTPNVTAEKPIMEIYYEESHKQWAEMIPYHIMIAVTVFVCNKWAVYAWNFGDVFLAILSRALYGQFKEFIINAKVNLLRRSSGNADWHQAILHHTKLCKITEDFAHLLSPYVFVSFGVNIYFLCLQVNLFIAPAIHLQMVDALYLGWSFLHLTARIIVVTVCASRINSYAHDFSKLLEDCPSELYSVEIKRAERQLAAYPVGLNGLGAFFIGKPLMLSIIGITFTFEIVLLQATAHLVPQPTNEDKEDMSGDLINMF